MTHHGREPILLEAGYDYNFNRMAYYNRDARKVFAVEWVRDHTTDEIQRAVNMPNESGEWQIFADPPPSRRVVSEFLAEING